MANLLIGSIIAALAGLAAGGSPSLPDRPVRLITERTDNGIRVRVVGESPVDVSVHYRLELGGGSGNRISQGGAATLEGGAEPTTLANIRMSGTSVEGRLIVELESGGGYEQPIGTDAR